MMVTDDVGGISGNSFPRKSGEEPVLSSIGERSCGPKGISRSLLTLGECLWENEKLPLNGHRNGAFKRKVNILE